MAASLREQLLARVATVLMGATPAGASVFRAREVSIARDVCPAITILYRGTPMTERRGQAADQHHVDFDIAIFVRGDPWDTAADAIDVPTHQLLMADPQLRALGMELVRRGDDVEAEEADRTAGCLIAHYRATFFTSARDLSALP